MMRRLQEKKRNRTRNAGGLPVDNYKTGLAMANALNELRPKKPGVVPELTTELNLFHIYFLYLWFTGQLSALTDAQSIPTLTLVSGSATCAPHCLRRIRESGISWVEYVVPYQTKQDIIYFWQPIPEALNPIFSYWLTHHNTQLGLTPALKSQLFAQLKERKWRTPKTLRRKNMLRKDVLYSYIPHQAEIDPYLSTPAKKAIMSGTMHHHSALSYQKLNSNQIRYEIFCAHRRYLARLTQAINTSEIKSFCDLYLPSSKTLKPIFSTPPSLPPYLKQTGEIVSYELQISDGARIYVPIPPISLGSERALEVADLTLFFHYLRQRALSPPAKDASNNALRHYYNLRTYELALLFVLLTGTRPNHHISIERDDCFYLRKALVKDKGRYRLIDICDYLREAICDYQVLQQRLYRSLSPSITSSLSVIWYLVDDKHHTQCLTAKDLRQFMAREWQLCFSTNASKRPQQQVVPYRLRHSFAQHALMSIKPRLSTQQIDLLMGHSELGEHLGSTYTFKGSDRMLKEFLNHWPELLRLSPIAQHTSNNKEKMG